MIKSEDIVTMLKSYKMMIEQIEYLSSQKEAEYCISQLKDFTDFELDYYEHLGD